MIFGFDPHQGFYPATFSEPSVIPAPNHVSRTVCPVDEETFFEILNETTPIIDGLTDPNVAKPYEVNLGVVQRLSNKFYDREIVYHWLDVYSVLGELEIAGVGITCLFARAIDLPFLLEAVTQPLNHYFQMQCFRALAIDPTIRTSFQKSSSPPQSPINLLAAALGPFLQEAQETMREVRETMQEMREAQEDRLHRHNWE